MHLCTVYLASYSFTKLMKKYLKGSDCISIICDRLWEKGPLGSGDQFSVYCPIRKNSFCAFKCTLKHKKLIFLTEVIALSRIGIVYKVKWSDIL